MKKNKIFKILVSLISLSSCSLLFSCLNFNTVKKVSVTSRNNAENIFKFDSTNGIIQGFAEGVDIPTVLTIPAEIDNVTVNEIGEGAFGDNKIIKKLQFDVNSQVKKIDSMAFINSSLESTIMSDSVTELGNNVFGKCSSLATITLSKNITNIPAATFQGTALKEITIPSKVTKIDQTAFAFTNVLNDKNVKLPEDSNFHWLNVSKAKALVLKEVTELTNDTQIQGGLLIGQLNLNDAKQITSIKNKLFGFNHLSTLVLSNKVKTIEGSGLISSMYLLELNIPSSVEEIGDYAFGNCYSLNDFYFNWASNQLEKLHLGNYLFTSSMLNRTIYAYLANYTDNLQNDYEAKFKTIDLGEHVQIIFKPAPSSNHWWWYILGGGIGVVICSIGGFAIYKIVRQNKKKQAKTNK